MEFKTITAYHDYTFFLMTHLKDSLLVLNRSRHTGDLWGMTTVSLWLGKYCFLTLHKMTCLLIAEGRSNRVYRAARCSSSAPTQTPQSTRTQMARILMP